MRRAARPRLEAPPRALAVRADVAEPAEGRALLAEVLAAFGRLDVWVNNAGVAPAARLDLLDTTPESWDRVLGINLRGPFFLTQAVARALVELVAAGTVRDPQIVFVTSVSSTFASVNRADYCVSKAGLSMAVQLFAARLAEQGILVYEVRPGIIATDMTGPVHADYDRRIKARPDPDPPLGAPRRCRSRRRGAGRRRVAVLDRRSHSRGRRSPSPPALMERGDSGFGIRENRETLPSVCLRLARPTLHAPRSTHHAVIVARNIAHGKGVEIGRLSVRIERLARHSKFYHCLYSSWRRGKRSGRGARSSEASTATRS